MPHKTMQMLAFAALTFILSPEPRYTQEMP